MGGIRLQCLDEPLTGSERPARLASDPSLRGDRSLAGRGRRHPAIYGGGFRGAARPPSLGRVIHRLHPVKTPATLLGMAGAVLVALPTAAPRMIGFASWMIANGLWIYLGMSTRDGYIAGLFGFYFLTTGFGIFNLI